VGLILILIFGEALALYGLIVSLILVSWIIKFYLRISLNKIAYSLFTLIIKGNLIVLIVKGNLIAKCY
jgi:hypothetical protein